MSKFFKNVWFFCKIIVSKKFYLVQFHNLPCFSMVVISTKSKFSQVSFQFPVLQMTCLFFSFLFLINFTLCCFRHWPFYLVLIRSTSYIYYDLEIDINFLVIPWGNCEHLPSGVPEISHSSGWIYAIAHPMLMSIIFPLVICSWQFPLVQILLNQSCNYHYHYFKWEKKMLCIPEPPNWHPFC